MILWKSPYIRLQQALLNWGWTENISEELSTVFFSLFFVVSLSTLDNNRVLKETAGNWIIKLGLSIWSIFNLFSLSTESQLNVERNEKRRK